VTPQMIILLLIYTVLIQDQGCP